MQPIALIPVASKETMLTEQAFAELVALHQRSLVQLACRLVGNVEDAKDLAQWAFARLWLNRHRLEAEREMFHYLRQVLVHLCIDYLRHRGKRAPEVEFDESQFSDVATTPLQELERQELQDQLLRCIDELKPKQKATLVLRDVEGYSVEETAEILSCTKNNVLCNLYLARENVRRKIQQKIRLGLEQVLSKIKTREGNAFGLSRSVQIFGKITATGYEPATRSRRITWNPQRALSALHQVDENKKMTIRQLLF